MLGYMANLSVLGRSLVMPNNPMNCIFASVSTQQSIDNSQGINKDLLKTVTVRSYHTILEESVSDLSRGSLAK